MQAKRSIHQRLRIICAFVFYKNKKAVAVQLLIAGEPRELKNEPQFFVTEDKEFFVKLKVK